MYCINCCLLYTSSRPQHLFQGPAAFVQVRQGLGGGQVRQVPVAEGVIADLVALLPDAPHQVLPAFDPTAHQKEMCIRDRPRT